MLDLGNFVSTFTPSTSFHLYENTARLVGFWPAPLPLITCIVQVSKLRVKEQKEGRVASPCPQGAKLRSELRSSCHWLPLSSLSTTISWKAHFGHLPAANSDRRNTLGSLPCHTLHKHSCGHWKRSSLAIRLNALPQHPSTAPTSVPRTHFYHGHLPRGISFSIFLSLPLDCELLEDRDCNCRGQHSRIRWQNNLMNGWLSRRSSALHN